MPSNNDFTPTNVWATSTPTGEVEELTLESGQTCLAVKMSIEAMVEAGMLAEADALTAQVNRHTRKVKGAKGKADATELDQNALLRDASGMQTMITLMDKAMPHIVVSPVVKLHYTEHKVGKTVITRKIPVEDRENNVVYTDQIGFGDKVELFNWAAGGLSAMLQFRQ